MGHLDMDYKRNKCQNLVHMVTREERESAELLREPELIRKEDEDPVYGGCNPLHAQEVYRPKAHSTGRLYQRSSSTPPVRGLSEGHGYAWKESREIPMGRISEDVANQVADVCAFNESQALDYGRNLQRSWSAPPIPDRLETAFSRQHSDQSNRQAHKGENVVQSDLWAKASFNYAPQTSRFASISPIASPSGSNLSYKSNSPCHDLSKTTSIASSTSGDDSYLASLSLLDKIQEDFPRTPSPVYDVDQAQQLDSTTESAFLSMNSAFNHLSLDGCRNTSDDYAGSAMYLGPMWHPAAQTILPCFGIPSTPSFQQCSMSPHPSLMKPRFDGYGARPEGHETNAFAASNLGYPEYVVPRSARRSLRSHSYQQQDAAKRNRLNITDPQYFSPAGSPSTPNYVHDARGFLYNSQSLLDEFKGSSKNEKWELSTIKGHLVVFAQDQGGSRFIQQKLEKASEQIKMDVFDEVYPHSVVLMRHVFGNYVIQKLFEHGSILHQKMLVEVMREHMVDLALQVYACRVIQKALDITKVNEQLILIQELRGHVLKCAVDQNGNHVLQKCIEVASCKKTNNSSGAKLQGSDIQFIIDDFQGKVASLSRHTYGCRVIQRLLEHCDMNHIRSVYNEIVLDCKDLVRDQFGNYVVQHLVEYGNPAERSMVMQMILPEISKWSQQKYASNVIEKCIIFASKPEIGRIVDQVLECDGRGACALLIMMKDMYGNYVVQKLLDRASKADWRKIATIVRHNAEYLKRFPYGKHVLSHVERQSLPEKSHSGKAPLHFPRFSN